MLLLCAYWSVPGICFHFTVCCGRIKGVVCGPAMFTLVVVEQDYVGMYFVETFQSNFLIASHHIYVSCTHNAEWPILNSCKTVVRNCQARITRCSLWELSLLTLMCIMYVHFPYPCPCEITVTYNLTSVLCFESHQYFSSKILDAKVRCPKWKVWCHLWSSFTRLTKWTLRSGL